MKTLKQMKAIIITLLCFTVFNTWAEKPKNFGFFFQGIYSDQVTLNRVKSIFQDFSETIKQPINFYGGPTIEDIKDAVTNNPFDLLIWGYSNEIDQYMINNDYQQLVSSPLQINMYQFNNTETIKDSERTIAILKNSTALYSAKHYYSKLNKNVEIITYDDYFLIVEACFRKEVNTIISAKPFFTLQPRSIKEKLSLIKTLPDHAKLSIWVKSDMLNSRKNIIVKYFIDRQDVFSQSFGSEDFTKNP